MPIYGKNGGDQGIQIRRADNSLRAELDALLGKSRFGDIDHGNYVELDEIGRLVAYGTGRMYEDIVVSTYAMTTGPSPPDLELVLASANMRGRCYDGVNTMEQLFGMFELIHDYAEGTNVIPHVHWSPTTNDAGNIKWQLEYSFANKDAVFPGTAFTSAIQAAAGAAWTQQRADFPALNGALFRIGLIFAFRLFRDPTDGQDTYGHDAWLQDLGIHYQLDTLGSRTVDAK